MIKLNTTIKELKMFLILWSTQALSGLGSAMTNFALVIWAYQQTGSALSTALLSICSYAPYVLCSIFAGALSDRWNKKITMLVSDLFAAGCTVVVLILLRTGQLQIWHLYVLNTLNGLMNTVQQPAADVSVSILTPKKYYHKISGLRTLSGSLVTLLTPVIAAAVLALAGINAVIAIDLMTFLIAFISLFCFIKIPNQTEGEAPSKENILQASKIGLTYLKENRGILDLILFLACINLIASMYNAALPAMVLSREWGGELALGTINTFTGIATLAGSIVMTILPVPKSRVRIICNTLLISMSTENFLLAFGKSVPVLCLGAILGWMCIPIMNANMDVLFRNHIPIAIQGRVYSVRNSLQFFTIPVGYLMGGILVDKVFEPFMSSVQADSFLTLLFGYGKGSGAAMLFLFIGFAGMLVCLIFRRDKQIWQLE